MKQSTIQAYNAYRDYDDQFSRDVYREMTPSEKRKNTILIRKAMQAVAAESGEVGSTEFNVAWHSLMMQRIKGE